MLRIVSAVVMTLLIFVTSASAQQAPDICYGSKQNYTQAKANFGKRRVADVPVDDNGVRQENRLSYWAYKHDSLHRRGIVDQILKQTKTNCCGSTDSGECRVSRINTIDHTVLVDGKWCPLSPNAATAVVEGLENDEEVVVCAGKTKRSFPAFYTNECPSTYCVGERGGS